MRWRRQSQRKQAAEVARMRELAQMAGGDGGDGARCGRLDEGGPVACSDRVKVGGVSLYRERGQMRDRRMAVPADKKKSEESYVSNSYPGFD